MKKSPLHSGMKQNSMRIFTSMAAIALALPFAASADELKWETNMDEAKARAAESEKPILVVFTGSDWCPPCIRLKSEVFEQQKFADYAVENLVLVELDFPRRKALPEDLVKQNRELQQKYGIRGYPTVLLLDADGEEFSRLAYRGENAEQYVENLKKLLAERE